MAREINLVPDIKNEMIKTLKLRNFIFFLCIVVASASVGVILIFGTIVGGQQLAINGKESNLSNLSSKITAYSDLKEFLTIQNQTNNIATLSSNKQVLSRTFNILTAIIPTGADTVQISELSVNLEGDPTFTFDAQANAGRAPFIDYNVLDSFKKSMEYMTYDYGEYVDKDGQTIPAYCIIESGLDGAMFKETTKNEDYYYAFWLIEGEGCDPSAPEDDETENDSEDTTWNGQDNELDNELQQDDATPDQAEQEVAPIEINGYQTEIYEGQRVVRIWRTPRFSEWYSSSTSEQSSNANTPNQPTISLNGNISGGAHFNSACITYSGELKGDDNKPTWTQNENSCKLVPDGEQGITISDSSNGRDSSDQLVLRFSASITFSDEAYKFANQHFMAIGPKGRRNVTDSYAQIQALFGERAADCEEGDADCRSNSNGNGGGN